MPPRKELPEFIAPMLARPGEPFDSERYLFEIKWDGTRALLFVEGDRYRLVNRRKFAISERYPEFSVLQKLAAGTVLDGEIVVLRDGAPDFELLLSREQARSPLKRRTAAVSYPATYLVFDQLYSGYEPLLNEPLQIRRERLRESVDAAGDSRIVFSDGIVGQGRAYFEKAVEKGLEGVVAKRLDSLYVPGKRTDAWQKFKRKQSLLCAIIGFVPAGDDDFRSLIIAADEGDGLRCVGKVGSGIDTDTRRELNQKFSRRSRPEPLVPSAERGKWLEPGLFCKVTYLERTRGGRLRGPVFEELIVE
ncbi:MAG: hypothetical protein O7J95_16790 [Planctomycetota bacterium]|nr:hypothetical protein [Planctomycetota bacterium]